MAYCICIWMRARIFAYTAGGLLTQAGRAIARTASKRTRTTFQSTLPLRFNLGYRACGRLPLAISLPLQIASLRLTYLILSHIYIYGTSAAAAAPAGPAKTESYESCLAPTSCPPPSSVSGIHCPWKLGGQRVPPV
eukprot:scaffold26341_cov129-Isochrysis_galbana.AAC.2